MNEGKAGWKVSRREALRAGLALAVTGQLASPLGAAEPTDGCIDAHVHVWTPETDRYPLKSGFPKEKMAPASFTPKELFAHCWPCGVSRIVLIQMSFYGFDNSYMLDMMRKHPGVFSGVAVIDANDKPRETMRQLARQGVRGFRIHPGKTPADEWLGSEGMAAMWKCGAEEGLAMCPLINPEYLSAIDRMCDRFPQTPVVIDHFARIGADGQIRPADVDNLCRLARHKRAHVKLSAYYALGKKQAPYLDLGPIIRRVVDAFGPERAMWASDSPFQIVTPHVYADSIELIRSRLDSLTVNDREWLLRKTAERVFFA
jgi:predicted TIM-barrel fold metal-dependent hydrolase